MGTAKNLRHHSRFAAGARGSWLLFIKLAYWFLLGQHGKNLLAVANFEEIAIFVPSPIKRCRWTIQAVVAIPLRAKFA